MFREELESVKISRNLEYSNPIPWPRGYKIIFILSLSEHEIFLAHKIATNCGHFNIYEQKNSILSLSEPKKLNFLIFSY